jgi:hypothetical protein
VRYRGQDATAGRDLSFFSLPPATMDYLNQWYARHIIAMTRNSHNCSNRIYDTNKGWQADPGTGLNLVNGKAATQPVDTDSITALKQHAQNRYDTQASESADVERSAAEQRRIDRLKRRATDQPDIPKVTAISLDAFSEDGEEEDIA